MRNYFHSQSFSLQIDRNSKGENMAFIGLLFVLLIAAVIILIIGIVPIIIGTVLYNKTEHKKIGIVFRILGYITLIPSIIIGVLMAIIMFRKF